MWQWIRYTADKHQILRIKTKSLHIGNHPKLKHKSPKTHKAKLPLWRGIKGEAAPWVSPKIETQVPKTPPSETPPLEGDQGGGYALHFTAI